MARNPFLHWSQKFLLSVGGNYAKTTKMELQRNLKRIEKELKDLNSENRISTYNPKKLSPQDIYVFVGHQRERGLGAKTVLHNLTALDKLLTFADNNAVQQYKVKFASTVPKHHSRRYQPMHQRDYELLLAHAEAVESHDWKRLRAYALVVLSIAAGLRHNEIRCAKRIHLNFKKRTIYVDQVKGKDSYGEPREVPIRSDAIPLLKRYTDLRDTVLSINGKTDNPFLFPALNHRSTGQFSHNGIQDMKNLVQQEVGLVFNLRTCRRTFGQLAVNEGLPIETVSVLMGHRTTKTTEQFYSRMENRSAIDKARRLWDKEPPYDLDMLKREPPGPSKEMNKHLDDDQDNHSNQPHQKESEPKRDRWEMTGYV